MRCEGIRKALSTTGPLVVRGGKKTKRWEEKTKAAEEKINQQYKKGNRSKDKTALQDWQHR